MFPALTQYVNIKEFMRRIVVKVGSNVLTREDGHLNVTRMSALVDQLAWLRRHDYAVILVSSGAVMAGRGELQVDHQLDSVEQGFVVVNEFDDANFGVVAEAVAEFEDAGVTTGAFGDLLSYFLEEFFDGFFALEV